MVLAVPIRRGHQRGVLCWQMLLALTNSLCADLPHAVPTLRALDEDALHRKARLLLVDLAEALAGQRHGLVVPEHETAGGEAGALRRAQALERDLLDLHAQLLPTPVLQERPPLVNRQRHARIELETRPPILGPELRAAEVFGDVAAVRGTASEGSARRPAHLAVSPRVLQRREQHLPEAELLDLCARLLTDAAVLREHQGRASPRAPPGALLGTPLRYDALERHLHAAVFGECGDGEGLVCDLLEPRRLGPALDGVEKGPILEVRQGEGLPWRRDDEIVPHVVPCAAAFDRKQAHEPIPRAEQRPDGRHPGDLLQEAGQSDTLNEPW
mmetsp:Transcript_92420/g.258280  ORF Transcript_92420/g.258280 Transcript_92420/m.258280 type:complete len:328 (+) Transcript_92420:938-1921(+)